MTQNIALDHEDIAHEGFFDPIQEVLSGAAPQLRIRPTNATTLEVVAGAGSDQASVSISGRYRWRTTNTTAALPGGLADGQHDVFVTASDNDFSGPVEDPDSPTNYSFSLVILAAGATPGTALWRRVGYVQVASSAITRFWQAVGSRARGGDPVFGQADHVSQAAMVVKGAAGQTADIAQVQNSSGAALWRVDSTGDIRQTSNLIIERAAASSAVWVNRPGDTQPRFRIREDGNLDWGPGNVATDVNLYRSSASVLATDDTLQINRGYGGSNAGAAIELGYGSSPGNYRHSFLSRHHGGVAGGNTLEWNLWTPADGAAVLGTLSAMRLTGNGLLQLPVQSAGSGLEIGGDTAIYRAAAGLLGTGGNLRVDGGGGGGVVQFGSSGDTNAYRYNAGILATDGQLFVNQGYIQAGRSSDGAAAYFGNAIWFGAPGSSGPYDTNLYRFNADWLHTDDGFSAGRTYLARADVYTTANLWTAAAVGNLRWDGTNWQNTTYGGNNGWGLVACDGAAGGLGFYADVGTGVVNRTYTQAQFAARRLMYLTPAGDLTVTGDINIQGGNLNMGAARPDYTVTNLTTDRTFNADSTTIDELADVLGTLIADLTTIGLLQ